MNLSKLTIGLFAAAGLTLSGAVLAQPLTKDARDQAHKAAEAQYKQERDACGVHSGNAKDVCVEEAKGREKVAKADADASYQNTPKTRENARLARAEAAYEVAKEKCDDLSGNANDVCVKQAKAALVKAKADAKKVDRVAADTRNDAVQKTADAQRAAADDKRDADYKVAIEKCDALVGAAKDACVRDAKTRYGRS